MGDVSPCWKCGPHPGCSRGCEIIARWKRLKGRRRLFQIVNDFLAELERAEGLHASMATKSHARGVISEEFDEFVKACSEKKNERIGPAMRTELIHLGAMCLRSIYDLEAVARDNPSGDYGGSK